MILSQQNMVNEFDRLDEPRLTKITNVLLSDQMNRMPCVALKMSPYEALFVQPPRPAREGYRATVPDWDVATVSLTSIV